MIKHPGNNAEKGNYESKIKREIENFLPFTNRKSHAFNYQSTLGVKTV